MGINIPLINTKGNFTTVVIILILAGVSEGAVDIRDPRAEKQKEAKIIPSMKTSTYWMLIPINSPTIIGIIVIIRPNKKEAKMSPRIMVDIRTGDETSLSKVLVLVSQGAIKGTTAAAVKKRAIEIKPGSRSWVEMFLPSPNARKRKIGSSTPNINTGALKK